MASEKLGTFLWSSKLLCHNFDEMPNEIKWNNCGISRVFFSENTYVNESDIDMVYCNR